MNSTADQKEGRQRGSKSVAALRTWSQSSLHKARSVLSDIGGYLAVTEEGSRLDEWKERLHRSASRGSISFSLDDLVSRKDSEDPALTRLEKVLFEDDRPEFISQSADLLNNGPSSFGKALFTSPELTGEKQDSSERCLNLVGAEFIPSPPSAHGEHIDDGQHLADDRILIQVCPAGEENFDILRPSASPHDRTFYTPTANDPNFVPERKFSPDALFKPGHLGDGSVPRRATKREVTTNQQGRSVPVGASLPPSILHTKPRVLDGPHTTPFYSFYTGAYKLPLKESTELGVASYTRQQQSLRRSRDIVSPGRRPLRPSSAGAASSPDQKPSTVSFSGEVSVTEFFPGRDQSPRSSEEEAPVSLSAEETGDQHPISVSESRHRKYIRRIVKRMKKSPSKSILKGSSKKTQKASRPLPQLDVQLTTLEARVSPEGAAPRTKTSSGRPLPRLPSVWQSPSSILPSPSSSSSSLASSVSWPCSVDSTLSRNLDISSDDEPSSEIAGGLGYRGSPESSRRVEGASPDRRVRDEGVTVARTGLKHYRPLRDLEENGQQFLDIGSNEAMRMSLLNRKQTINSALKEAQEKYGKTLPEAETAMFEEKAEGKLIDPRDHPYLRAQMDALPSYSPIVILIISIAQIVVFGTFCVLGGTADIALEHTVVTANNIHTFMGRESVQRVTTPNLWIGPTMTYWIGQGATFAPCMRDDYVTNLYLAQRQFDLSVPLGCCELPTRDLAGTTTQAECDTLTGGTGSWRATPCGSRLAGESATAAHIMRPCCYGIMGKCKLTTLQHCTFVNGVYSSSGEEHCSKVNCLAQTCGPGDLSSDPAQPYKPRSSALTSQWWRWLLSPWLHAGLIHLLLVVAVQCVVGVRIERMVGGVRLAIVYLICGAGGNMTGAVFSPYSPQMGGSAAACGLLGCACVELLQAWTLVPRALCKLLTLLTVLTILLMAGTLPLVDNWAQLGGFVFGLLSALVFLPYIVLGRWDAQRKRCLVVFGFVMLVLMYAVLLMMFYYVQGDFCPACQHFNCIPYTTDACHQPEDNYP
ncbi:RHBDF2 [Branchiostoma lanceolatum]|uniref:RHBDF2 protein n=1 Tax=Branchiostoma lanceolatum TaxID=7740 RepID=A0A8K0EQQ9_BRALA|nr:RHBDF2 [Branchiostoma lanceolatum]